MAPPLLSFLSALFILRLYCCVHAQTASLTLGSKLLPSQTPGLVSNGSFQLAFYSTAASPDAYSLGIMYHSIANQTVVWTAGRNVQVGQNAFLQLTLDGNLVLSNNSGPPLWTSNTSNRSVAGATLQADGNLVLLNSTGGNVWQSFDSPTDTLLPGQIFRIGQTLQADAPANTTYTATMEATGNLSLSWNNSSGVYWSSDTSAASYASLQTTTFGLYNAAAQAVRFWLSNDYTENPSALRRVTLDGDGNLKMYSWPTSASAWSVVWQAVEDQCEVEGFCGPNGLCTYNSSGPTCVCLQQAGYTSIDAANPRIGCRAPAAGAAQTCSSATASMVPVNHTFLFSISNPFRYGDADCQTTCLKNQLCIASTAVNDGSGMCRLLVGSSFSGYQELSISSNSFFKVCGSVPPVSTAPPPSSSSSSSSSNRSLVVPVIASILGTLLLIIVLQAAVWYCCCRKNVRFRSQAAQYALLEYASGAPVQFSYRELQGATRNFSEKLGEGGFGAVYRGVLANKTEVGIKQLEGVDQGEKQFRTEVTIIGSTHHMNLVRLCGFCAEGKHRLLVYEFMKNGSLDRYLFGGADDTPNLQWETRFNVLLGTARGITYLHQECRDCIIHCDIKPENILLDENFCAKVSDFGLAKLTNAKDRARSLTTVRGTRGYLAPEWRSNLPITAKTDVFSFGIVVLETISGRKTFDTSITSSDRQSFSEWAFHEYFEHKRVEGVVDSRVREKLDMEEMDRALRVSYWCMQVQPSLRPSMSKVIQMLEGTLPVDIPPMPRSFGELTSEDTALFRALEDYSASRTTRTTSSSLDSFANVAALPRPPLPLPLNQTTSFLVNPSSHTFSISKQPGALSF